MDGIGAPVRPLRGRVVTLYRLLPRFGSYGADERRSLYLLKLKVPVAGSALFSRQIVFFYDRYFATIGKRRPTPKALLLTRMMGQNWLRLYSFMFTSRKVLFTSAGS